MARLQVHAVDEQQRDTADDERDADQHRRFEQHLLDEPVQQHPGESGREERQHDADDETPRRRIVRQRQGDLPQPREIDRQDRQHRAELNEHLERLAGALEAEKVPGQQQVGGR